MYQENQFILYFHRVFAYRAKLVNISEITKCRGQLTYFVDLAYLSFTHFLLSGLDFRRGLFHVDGAGDGVEADGVVLEETVDEAGGTHLGGGKAAQMRTVDKGDRVAE